MFHDFYKNDTFRKIRIFEKVNPRYFEVIILENWRVQNQEKWFKTGNLRKNLLILSECIRLFLPHFRDPQDLT